MLMQGMVRLWSQTWASILRDIRADEAGALVSAQSHTMRLTARRTAVIVSRVRLLAAAFTLLTPLWGIAEYWTMTADMRLELAPVAVLASIAFAAILVLVQGTHTLRHAYHGLFFLFAVLGAFFLYCYLNALHQDADGVLDGLAAGYAYLPFVMLGVIAVFPLTLVESASLAAFVLSTQVVAWLPNLPTMYWLTAVGWLGMLTLIGALAILATVSQLAFLFVMVREGLHDSVTGCYSRRAGEDLLDLLFTWCLRSQANAAVALISPDGLQSINERFGYDAGEALLKDITVRLNDSMRGGDILVRWVGNEFLMVMPLASREQAAAAVQRLLANGLGTHPDGKAVTASIGIADRVADEAEDWWMLVDAGVARLAAARQAGGNVTVAA